MVEDWGEPGWLDGAVDGPADGPHPPAPLLGSDPVPAVSSDPVAGLGGGSGAPSAQLCARLEAIDPTGLETSDLLDLAIAWDRVLAWAQAHKHTVLAALDRSDTSTDHWIQEELATALRLAPVTAANLLSRSRTLLDRLPRTHHALHAGTITDAQANTLIDSSHDLPPELAPALEAAVLDRAGDQTLSELKRSLARALHRIDPTGAQASHARAHTQRSVWIRDAGHGMAELWALLPAPDAHAIYQRLDAAARTTPHQHPHTTRNLHPASEPQTTSGPQTTGDLRTVGARRADALVNAILAGLPLTGLPTEQGRHPSIAITIPATTLLGHTDEPATLEGYGPITAATARHLASDPTSTWRHILTDPAGHPIHISPPLPTRPPTSHHPGTAHPGKPHPDDRPP